AVRKFRPPDLSRHELEHAVQCTRFPGWVYGKGSSCPFLCCSVYNVDLSTVVLAAMWLSPTRPRFIQREPQEAFAIIWVLKSFDRNEAVLLICAAFAATH